MPAPTIATSKLSIIRRGVISIIASFSGYKAEMKRDEMGGVVKMWPQYFAESFRKMAHLKASVNNYVSSQICRSFNANLSLGICWDERLKGILSFCRLVPNSTREQVRSREAAFKERRRRGLDAHG